MSRINVAILGASGYTGGELLRLLLNHRYVNISYLTAERHAGKMIADVFPGLRSIIDKELHTLSPRDIPADIDVVFLALPHGRSSEVVKELYYNTDVRIIDLGADFRLSHRNYQLWYGSHECPELIGEAVYGITELYRDEISSARIVANPGCYPTSVILGVIPLLKAEVVDPVSIIADSKSGVTGAGRAPLPDLHYCEVNEGMKAYKIGEHRHAPEMEEVLGNLSSKDVFIQFTPHLIPVNRGILSTIYLRLLNKKDTSELLGMFRDFYSGSEFVRICAEGDFPSTSFVRGSNYCDIGVRSFPDKGIAVVVSAIDNLVKGASGQAVHNMNVMMDYPEKTGLEEIPLFP